MNEIKSMFPPVALMTSNKILTSREKHMLGTFFTKVCQYSKRLSLCCTLMLMNFIILSKFFFPITCQLYEVYLRVYFPLVLYSYELSKPTVKGTGNEQSIELLFNTEDI